MILLFTNQYDMSTKKIMEWLGYHGENFYCLQKDVDYIEVVFFDASFPEKTLLNISDQIRVHVGEIKSVFFRGGHIRPKKFFNYVATPVSLEEHVRAFLHAYSVAQIEVVSRLLSERLAIGKNGIGRFNKMTALLDAASVGLAIPHSIVTTNKTNALDFYAGHSAVITKSIDNNFSYRDKSDNTVMNQYTYLLSATDLAALPETFPPTLFQEYIEKDYEIRVFVLLDEIYAVAVFSQQQSNTRVDMRNYNMANMNRYIPVRLPVPIPDSILDFMGKSGLNTGSIDLIRAKSGIYYFLEINPIGQFGYVSDACNYNLEYVIAKKLIARNEQQN